MGHLCWWIKLFCSLEEGLACQFIVCCYSFFFFLGLNTCLQCAKHHHAKSMEIEPFFNPIESGTVASDF
jgi:hypothetical protein